MLTLRYKQSKEMIIRFFSATATFLMLALTVQAQSSQPFKGHFVNDEYNVYMHINLYGEGMNIPDHDLFGPLPGYLAKNHNGFYWLITEADVKDNKKAEIQLINDYGSEDLTATLRLPNDSTLVLEQGAGSTIKVPKDGKWQKLPGKLTFKRK